MKAQHVSVGLSISNELSPSGGVSVDLYPAATLFTG